MFRAVLNCKFPPSFNTISKRNWQIGLGCNYSTQLSQAEKPKFVVPKGLKLPQVFGSLNNSLQQLHREAFPEQYSHDPTVEYYYDKSNPVTQVDLRERWSVQDLSNKKFWISTGFWRLSQWKLTLVANQVKGQSLREAILQMKFSRKKTAFYVHEALARAVDAAKERNLDVDKMRIIGAVTGRGSYLKEIDYMAKGRHGLMRHPTSYAKFLLKEIVPKPRVFKPKVLKEDYVQVSRKMNYYFYF